jgi:predicted GNAT family acetyltransferase
LGLNLEEVTVKHYEQEQRFEAIVDGMRALITYHRSPGRIMFLHTEVPPPLEGQGLAAKLVRVALEFARAQQLQVVPICPYVSSFMRKNPEYQDLLSPEQLQKLLAD